MKIYFIRSEFCVRLCLRFNAKASFSRKFKESPLSDDAVKKIEAGQSASTSSYLQTYSIIGDDPKIKRRFKEVSGQPYVVDNGYLFVFVLDYYRHSLSK